MRGFRPGLQLLAELKSLGALGLVVNVSTDPKYLASAMLPYSEAPLQLAQLPRDQGGNDNRANSWCMERRSNFKCTKARALLSSPPL